VAVRAAHASRTGSNRCVRAGAFGLLGTVGCANDVDLEDTLEIVDLVFDLSGGAEVSSVRQRLFPEGPSPLPVFLPYGMVSPA
jgi:hypothetical protein